LSGPDRFHNRTEIWELRRCAKCSIVWLLNPPAPHDMGRHYGADYHRAITGAAETSAPRWIEHQRIVSQYKQRGAALDIGCSSGSFLASYPKGAWSLSGIEISAPEAELARARTGANVFVGDILDAPFPAESFDVVTSFDVLEHLHQPKASMEKIWHWLKPGGIFYVYLPNISSWEASLFKSYWYGLELPRHLFHFSPAALRHLLGSIGFSEVRLTTPPIAYVEYSTRYVYDDCLRAIGINRPSLAQAPQPNVAWKVIRKAWRMTALTAFRHVASMAGGGPGIEAIFQKEVRTRPSAAPVRV